MIIFCTYLKNENVMLSSEIVCINNSCRDDWMKLQRMVKSFFGNYFFMVQPPCQIVWFTLSMSHGKLKLF